MILIAVCLYFITSSDSGSYVDDLISAMGYENPPVLQKVYWCFTRRRSRPRSCTSGGLTVLAQAVSIVCGFPYTFALNFMCLSLWRAFLDEFGDETQRKRKSFNTCLFDFLEVFKPKLRVLTLRIARRVSSRPSKTSSTRSTPSSSARKLSAPIKTSPCSTARSSPAFSGPSIGLLASASRRGRALRGVADVLHLRLLRRQHRTRASRIQKYSWQRHGRLYLRHGSLAVCSRANGTGAAPATR